MAFTSSKASPTGPPQLVPRVFMPPCRLPLGAVCGMLSPFRRWQQPPITLGGLFASWTFDKEMSEDCLALNVWTPGLRDGAKRPVMVWFHGGDFSSLSGSRNVFDGVRLCQRGDVVVVTVNHRLNAFGYMYLAEVAPAFGAAV